MPISKYDLIERTGKIGQDVILVCKKIKLSPINTPLVNQIVKSATSIGANYCEATEANSKKDFCSKLFIAKKEAKETLHWIKMIAIAEPDVCSELDKIADEAHQIILIFSASIKSCSEK